MDPLNRDPHVLTIHSEHWQEMKAHVARQAPEEACGLVAGLGHRSQAVYPVSNMLHSPFQFKMEPKEQLSAFLEIEQHGWDLLAIYHSHPAGPTSPSPTDVANAYYPEAAHLIWFQLNGEWRCRAFTIENKVVSEIVMEFAPKM